MTSEQLDARLAAEYQAARLRIQATAARLDDEQAAAIVPACPAWTVHDLVAHVAALAADLGAGRRPGEEGTQAWVDAQVAVRRERHLSDVIAEWSDAAPAFEAMIEARPHRLWGIVYDVVVHEHDLHNAVGVRGERDGEGVDVALELGLRLVAMDLSAKQLPAFRLVTDGTEHVVGDGEPELTLTAPPFEALRLLGSRRTADELRSASFDGDLDRYLPGLLHMDPPTRSLGE